MESYNQVFSSFYEAEPSFRSKVGVAVDLKIHRQKNVVQVFFKGRPIMGLSCKPNEVFSGSLIRKTREWWNKLNRDIYKGNAEELRNAEDATGRHSREVAMERIKYGAEEYLKYGVRGSQAPGACSVIVDGNKGD